MKAQDSLGSHGHRGLKWPSGWPHPTLRLGALAKWSHGGSSESVQRFTPHGGVPASESVQRFRSESTVRIIAVLSLLGF
jgi:hypothetical protein